MSDYIARLDEQRKRAWERAKEIMDRADAEGREVSAEERGQLDQIETAMAGFKADAEQIKRMADIAAATDVFRVSQAPVVEAARAERRDPSDNEILASMLRGERRSHEFATRSLTTPGGSAIPDDFRALVTVYERTLVPVLQVATVLDTPTGAPIVLPRLTADQSVAGTVTAEAAAITAADPTISSVQLDSYKYAIITQWSAELGQDNVIGLGDLVARSAARELSIDIGAHLTTGDGSSKPNGYIAAATNGGTASGTASGSTTDNFFGPADLVDLYYGLAAPYRANGSWLVSTTAAAKMRKFRDNDKAFIWEPGSLAGGSDRFLGRPVFENPAMAAVASASKSVAFGDFSRYFVRRLPLRVEVSSDYAFNTDLVSLKVVERIDGDLVDTAAIAYLVSANS